MAVKIKIVATDKSGKRFTIPDSSIHRIETILWESKVFVHQTELPARLRNSLISHAPTKNSRTKYILFDRNIASAAAQLFNDTPRDRQDRDIALAVILFMRLCKFTPSALSALHEYESQNQGIQAYNEAVSFCRSLAASIDAYLDVLNANSKCLKLTDVPDNLEFDAFTGGGTDFQFSSTWLCSYAATLKLAALERDSSVSKRKKLEKFLAWVYHHFFFTPPLWAVASQFLGVRREQSIIKNIGTEDISKLRKNIRNSAWDINVLLEWHLKSKRQEFCILASRDTALRRTATRMRDMVFSRPDQVRHILSEDWPASKDVDSIVGVITEYIDQLDDPLRPVNCGLSREYYQQMIIALENDLGLHAAE